MTVKDRLNDANPNDIADNARLARLGDGLALIARQIPDQVVASDIGVLPATAKAKAILSCYVQAPAGVDYLTPVLTDAAPGAGEVAINPLGDLAFNAGDAVTEVDVIYIPVEGELFEDEVIPVSNATELGTVLSDRGISQVVSVELNAPAATPGVKTVVARGTTPAAPLGAGECAVQANGHDIGFLAAEVGASDCTATVTYWAQPGVGNGVPDGFGARLEAADSDDAGI